MILDKLFVSDIIKRVIKSYCEFNKDVLHLNNDTTFEELSFDEFDIMEIIFITERELCVKLPDVYQTAFQVNTIGKLAEEFCNLNK